MYWDISLHIDNGRDPGPLANPAHYLILVGLYGALARRRADDGALARSDREPRPCTSARAGGRRSAASMMAACGAFALSGFPLDDLWHRLFGQDVTLWGPTHLMLIGGALARDARRDGADGRGDHRRRPRSRARGDAVHATSCGAALLVGGFLVALSTFQGEFDFGVPQFRDGPAPDPDHAGGRHRAGDRARSTSDVAARCSAVAGFLVIRGFLALMVGVRLRARRCRTSRSTSSRRCSWSWSSRAPARRCAGGWPARSPGC